MNAVPKQNPVRDRRYLDWLRTQPCLFTGANATESDAVDPAHIGTLGKSIKSSDDEAIPLLHSLHVKAHQGGEMSYLKGACPYWLFRAALRAYARELYREYLSRE